MNKKRILIFDGFCKQCLPFIRGFKNLGCEVTIVCGSRLDCGFASLLPDHKILLSCDLRNSEESGQELMRIVIEGNYDLVIPLFDGTVRLMAANKQSLSKYAIIYVNDKDVFESAFDKDNVMRVCEQESLPHPRTVHNVESVDDPAIRGIQFPIIIKPKRMYGARGFHIFESEQDLKAYVKRKEISLKEYVIQEYIPTGSRVMGGNIFIDRDGVIKSSYLYICQHLYPENGGTSTLNAILVRPDIQETCERLVKAMNLRGIVGVDLMLDIRDNIGKVIEINVRPVHGISLGFFAGINHAQQVYEDAFGLPVTPMEVIRTDICSRIMQTDVLWFLSSKDRFRRSPHRLGYKVKEQMFFWDDPLPWFAFLFDGMMTFVKKMREKKV